MNTKKQTHIPYAFITALVMIIVGVVLQIADLSMTPGMQWIPFLVMLIGLILNAQAFSKANDADITFGQAFSSGFKASAIIAIVFMAWSVISLYIFPEIYTQVIEKMQEEMEKQQVSEEQREMTIEMTRKYFKVAAAGGAMVYALLFGAVFSLIAAAIAKKAPRPQTQIQ